jgi:hypothetical protein
MPLHFQLVEQERRIIGELHHLRAARRTYAVAGPTCRDFTNGLPPKRFP